MTDRLTPVDMSDLTPREIERLMRAARRERSEMAHKLAGQFFSFISSSLKGVTLKLMHVVRDLLARLAGTPPAAPGATKGMSHV